jgi:two-component system phosphate regulon sensor histidine kinase PhoR
MLSSRLFWKLFLPNAALTIALSLGLAIGVSIWHKRMVMEQVEKRLLDTALILESHVAESSTADPSDASRGELQELVQSLSQSIGSRLTVIGADGAVWADSHEDPAVMENHASRPEVQQAAQHGFGKSTRRSPTLGMRMFYVAVPVVGDGDIDGDGERNARGFVRAAVAIDTIEARLSTVRWLMALFALAASLAALG